MSTKNNNTEVFVWAGEDWDEALRKHHAAAWMEQYTKTLDKADWSMPWPEYHDPDMELHKADGTIIKGAEQSWEGLKQLYGSFKAFSHQPQYAVVWENKKEGGWTLFGVANLYVRFPVDSAGEKVTDYAGKSWDLMIPSAFRFNYVEKGDAKHDGILLKRTDIYGDSGPVVINMLKRGMIQPEMLLA